MKVEEFTQKLDNLNVPFSLAQFGDSGPDYLRITLPCFSDNESTLLCGRLLAAIDQAGIPTMSSSMRHGGKRNVIKCPKEILSLNVAELGNNADRALDIIYPILERSITKKLNDMTTALGEKLQVKEAKITFGNLQEALGFKLAIYLKEDSGTPYIVLRDFVPSAYEEGFKKVAHRLFGAARVPIQIGNKTNKGYFVLEITNPQDLAASLEGIGRKINCCAPLTAARGCRPGIWNPNP